MAIVVAKYARVDQANLATTSRANASAHPVALDMAVIKVRFNHLFNSIFIYLKILVCSPGFYGMNCLDICSCSSNARCDPVSGRCGCKAGFRGTGCTQSNKGLFCLKK